MTPDLTAHRPAQQTRLVCSERAPTFRHRSQLPIDLVPFAASARASLPLIDFTQRNTAVRVAIQKRKSIRNGACAQPIAAVLFDAAIHKVTAPGS